MSQPTLLQCIQRARRYLGVKDIDPEFPTAHLLDVANTCLSGLYDDCIRLSEDEAATTAVLAPVSSDSRTYSLSAQDAPLSILRVLSLRLDDEEGVILTQLPISQLDAYRGMSYALTGSEGAQQITLSSGVRQGPTLFLRYIPLLDEVESADAPLPAFVPARYRDVLSLMIAREVWPQGGEASTPGELLDRLDARESQLHEVWSKRSADLTMRRDTGGGIAPYLF